MSNSIELNEVEVLDLIAELKRAAELYYQLQGESGLSDADYDAKLARLGAVRESGLFAHLFGAGSDADLLLEGDVSGGSKVSGVVVRHEVPMLSLKKATNVKELFAFLKRARLAGAESFRLQAKMDGIAMSARYEDGKLVRLATRGDGELGEDITYLSKASGVSIVGLPHSFAGRGDLEVRGELFFTDEQFKKVDDSRRASEATGEGFSNARMAASGLMRKANSAVPYDVEFTFASYAVLVDGAHADMDSLPREGFVNIDEFTQNAVGAEVIDGLTSDEELAEAVDTFGVSRATFPFPTDGVVIKPSNEAAMLNAMGSTGHHPSSQIAWKYATPEVQTKVKAIEITVGRSGKITPVANFDKVKLDGSFIDYASLHNFNIVDKLNVRVGSLVMITKALEIIPQVTKVIHNDESTVALAVPEKCPSCGEKLWFDESKGVWPPQTMRCVNEDCPARMFASVRTAVGRKYLDIKHLGESTLTALHREGLVNDIADLYDLTVDDLANLVTGENSDGAPRRLGEKNALKIIEQIELSKSRPLVRVLPALSIDLIGVTASKALEKHFGSLEAILSASQEELLEVEKFGEGRARSAHEGLKRRRPLIDRLLSAGVTFESTVSASAPASEGLNSPLVGLSFSISGAVPSTFANRDALVEYLEAHGALFHSSPKRETSYMIGDDSGSSSKIKKAISYVVQFISPEEFVEKFVR